MIFALRQRHRILMGGLAVFLPAAFLIGLVTRQPPAVMSDLSFFISGIPAEPEPGLGQREFRVDGIDVTARWYGMEGSWPRLVLELQPGPGQALKFADVLVYWASEPVSRISDLAEKGYLLGPLAGNQARRFILPPEALPGTGVLVFFSLANQEIIESAGLLPNPEPDRTYQP